MSRSMRLRARLLRWVPRQLGPVRAAPPRIRLAALLRANSGTNPRRRTCADESGTSAVEFAIVAPVLLMIVFGIGIYGIYLGAQHNLDQLAAEAARATVSGITDDERADLARRSVDTAQKAGSLFRQGSLSIAVGSDPADEDIYTVTLRFDATTLGLKGLARLVPMPPDLLRSSVSVRRGGL